MAALSDRYPQMIFVSFDYALVTTNRIIKKIYGFTKQKFKILVKTECS